MADDPVVNDPVDCLTSADLQRLPHPTKAALEVVEEYASVMGVCVSRTRVEESNLPPEYLTMCVSPRNIYEPMYLAFWERSVLWYSPHVRHVLYGLVHEVSHAVFPKPGRDDGPEWEWQIGLIPYELSWLDALCPPRRHRPGLLQWEQIWRKYGNEGRPDHPTPREWRKGRALEVAEKFNLPVPRGILIS